VKREKEQNFLKAPLTLVLSRKGREESKKEYPPHPTSLPRVERGEKGRERGE
jgi:hypothetical protein